MRRLHTYVSLRRGVDHDGWYKIFLRRDDGREVAVSRSRYRQLLREDRISEREPNAEGAGS